MTNTELVLNMLAETATKEISQQKQPTTIQGNIQVTKQGGEVAKIARETLEKTIGRTIISQKNAQDLIAEKQAQSQQRAIAQHTDEIIDYDI